MEWPPLIHLHKVALRHACMRARPRRSRSRTCGQPIWRISRDRVLRALVFTPTHHRDLRPEITWRKRLAKA